jgi:hypothetical protein
MKSASILTTEASALLARDDTSWSAARLLGVAYGIAGENSSPQLTMLLRRFTALDSMLAAVLQPSSGVTALAFSGDGTHLFAGHLDGSVSVWSTTDWRLTKLASMSSVEASDKPSRADATRTAPPVRALSVGYDGRYVAVVAGTGVTVWNTERQSTYGAIDVSADEVAHVSDDGASIVLTDRNKSRFGRYVEGNYLFWEPPAPSDQCRSAIASTARGIRGEITRFAISGDGSTLVYYQRVASGNTWVRELSVFALGRSAPVKIATHCDQAWPDIDQVTLNFNGTAIGLQKAAWCGEAKDECELTEVTYRHKAGGSGALEPLPKLMHPVFDARRPGVVLDAVDGKHQIKTIDGVGRRTIAPPCRLSSEIDMVDGKLAMIGECGRFVLADEDRAISGQIPITRDSTAYSNAELGRADPAVAAPAITRSRASGEAGRAQRCIHR